MSKRARLSSYAFRPELSSQAQRSITVFQELVQQATIEFLNLNWHEDIFDELMERQWIPAYKFLDLKQVILTHEDDLIYLPERLRRCIAESAGETIRSQDKRRSCFYEVRAVLLNLDLTTKLNTLVYQVNQTLRGFYDLFLKWQMVKQTIRQIKRWVLKYHVDIWSLNYTQLVKPKPKTVNLTFAPDDDRILRYTRSSREIILEVLLPQIAHPRSRKDWKRQTIRLSIPEKIKPRLRGLKQDKPKRPLLRFFTTKGGHSFPLFQFAWEYANITLNYEIYHKKRVLAVDLGLVNFATSVVCHAGLQLAPPQFFSSSAAHLKRIERRYSLIDILQNKIAKLPDSTLKKAGYQQAVSKIHAKLRRSRQQDVYRVVNWLLQQAHQAGCAIIAIEDLRFYEPPRKLSRISRRLSNWLRGSFAQTLYHKAELQGLTVKAVNPAWTSSFCPRCGHKGQKIREPGFRLQEARGRYFYCPSCRYCADRDYVGALNVYRRYREDVDPPRPKKVQKSRKIKTQEDTAPKLRQSKPKKKPKPLSLAQARPVLYQRTVPPLHR